MYTCSYKSNSWRNSVCDVYNALKKYSELHVCNRMEMLSICRFSSNRIVVSTWDTQNRTVL